MTTPKKPFEKRYKTVVPVLRPAGVAVFASIEDLLANEAVPDYMVARWLGRESFENLAAASGSSSPGSAGWTRTSSITSQLNSCGSAKSGWPLSARIWKRSTPATSSTWTITPAVTDGWQGL